MSAQDDIFADIEWPEEQHLEENDQDDQWPDDWPDDTSNIACPDFDQELPNLEIVEPDCTSTKAVAAENCSRPQATHNEPDGPPTDSRGTTVDSKAQTSGARFSKNVKSILRVWFNEHRENPYPTSSEKDQLAARTGLRRNQISLWLANTRRRYRSKRQEKNDLTEIANNPRETLTPYDRWRLLPWFQEATAPPKIIKAAAEFPVPQNEPETVAPNAKPASLFSFAQSADASHYDTYYAPSMASYETGLTSMVNGTSISDSTLQTFASQTISSRSSHGKGQERRRRRHQVTRPTQTGIRHRPFQCTFCHDALFATKYDWQRHEKSQHISLERWMCCPTRAIISSRNNDSCAFCGIPNRDLAHLETHHYSACQNRDLADRTFYRKDHLVQHLRLTHGSEYHAQMNDWQIEQKEITSRCGFCNATFETWQSRIDHVALHFKDRLDMSQWRGDLGLEPHVLLQVEKMTRVFGTGIETSNLLHDSHTALTCSAPRPSNIVSGCQHSRLPDQPGSQSDLQMLKDQPRRVHTEFLVDVDTTQAAFDAIQPTPGGWIESSVDLADWDVGLMEAIDWTAAW